LFLYNREGRHESGLWATENAPFSSSSFSSSPLSIYTTHGSQQTAVDYLCKMDHKQISLLLYCRWTRFQSSGETWWTFKGGTFDEHLAISSVQHDSLEDHSHPMAGPEYTFSLTKSHQEWVACSTPTSEYFPVWIYLSTLGTSPVLLQLAFYHSIEKTFVVYNEAVSRLLRLSLRSLEMNLGKEMFAIRSLHQDGNNRPLLWIVSIQEAAAHELLFREWSKSTDGKRHQETWRVFKGQGQDFQEVIL
jgi:hypothetical protein